MNIWTTLPERSVLCVTGHDRQDFLQGLVTQDLTLLQNRVPVFSAFLSTKGLFQGDFFVIPLQDRLLLDCHQDHAASLHRALSAYAALSDCQVHDVTQEYAVCVGFGENVLDLFHLDNKSCDHDDKGRFFFIDPRHPCLGIRSLVPYQHLHALPVTMLLSGTPKQYHYHRLQHHVPDGAHDLIEDKSVILEYGYHFLHAISFEKGCYRGQELMARTYHRGQIRKKACTVMIQDNTVPPKGTTLFVNQDKVGLMGGGIDDLAMVCLYSDKCDLFDKPCHVTYEGGSMTLSFYPKAA